jgi:metal-dependent amidase/aminoacylase/carboxypeptidase family protein
VRNSKSIGTSPPPAIGTPTGDAAQAPGSPPAANTPKTTAEKDMEFRKRQQEAREKSDKEAKEAAQAAQNRANCERARLHLQALESGRRMILPDGKGGETFLEDAQRGEEIERTRNTIAESCK